jgi:hypothetical protein
VGYKRHEILVRSGRPQFRTYAISIAHKLGALGDLGGESFLEVVKQFDISVTALAALHAVRHGCLPGEGAYVKCGLQV